MKKKTNYDNYDDASFQFCEKSFNDFADAISLFKDTHREKSL